MLKVISRLEDLPNIGKSIAADLRGLGILSPAELFDHDPLETFDALAVISALTARSFGQACQTPNPASRRRIPSSTSISLAAS